MQWPVDLRIVGPPNCREECAAQAAAKSAAKEAGGPIQTIFRRIIPMMITITRLYDDYASASQAVMDLEAAGVPSKDISLVASNAGNWYEAKTTKKKAKIDRDHDGVDDRV